MLNGYNVYNNIKPTIAPLSVGYQPPGPCAADPYYPAWLKGIVYLSWNGSSITENDGLITKPCSLSGTSPSVSLTANPTSITSGQSSTLIWSSNVTSCTGTGFTASGTSGSTSVSPANTTTYSISCSGTGGSASANTTVTVTIPDTTAPSTPTGLSGTAVSSSQINLTWTTSTDNVAVTGYKIFRNGTQIATSATNSYSNTGLTASTAYRYTVSAYDAASNNSVQSTSVSVTTPAGTSAPTVTISASPTSVTSGGSSTITWSSTNATSCTASGGWTGTKASSGSQSLTNLTTTATYTLACTGAGGTATQSATVTVTGGSGTITMGETNVLTAGDGGNANLLLSQEATLSQTATIQSLSFHVTNAAGSLRLGIYDATGPGGGPGALKAQTNAFTPVVGWNTASVITPVSSHCGKLLARLSSE